MSVIVAIFIATACKTPQAILDKSGAQLWGENCARCHNAPSPATYSDDQWHIIMGHMKIKAGLTDLEVKKIATFLKSAN
ncbi:MAG: cytochrome c [Bacteroidetes bacterium]|nr:cytochrome c [Bacteroidota bacterium]